MSFVMASEASTVASETLFVLALIVIAGPLLAEKARLPGLIGFMLGGIALGPFGVGVLAEGQLDGIGAIGILYLMFMAGLELDMDTFNRYRTAALQFGVLTFAVPFALGWWAGNRIGFELAESILLGSIWASHTLVALPIVKRAGLSASRAVAVGAGATIITDTLALVILAVISSGAAEAVDLQSADTSSTLLRLVIGLAVLVFVTTWVFPRVGQWFFAGPGNDRPLRFMFLVGAMALAGLMAEWGGIEGIVGAFFAGLGLNRLVPKRSALMERVEFFGSSFFIPAFLISVGMLIDPALIIDFDVLRTAGLFLLVVVVGKAVASAIGGGIFRFGWQEVGLLFSMTIGQAAATLAAALVGVNIGLFDLETLNSVVVTVLFTVLLSSVLTKVFAGLVPPDDSILRPIGSSVVVPVPLGSNPDHALRAAGAVARSSTGTVTPLVVVPSGQFSSRAGETAKELVEQATAAANTSGAEAEGLVRVDSDVKSAVLNVVAERDASLIVLIAPESRRVSELAFGGPINSIGGASPVPTVLAVGLTEPPERVLVAAPGRHRTMGDQVDSEVAIQVTTAVAGVFELPIVVLVGPGTTVPDISESAELVKVPDLTRSGVSGVIEEKDLVVLPLALVRRAFVSSSPYSASTAGLLITAGPHRLHRAGDGAETVSTVFGFSSLRD